MTAAKLDCDNDTVASPPHYCTGGIECIDALRSALGRDGFISFCRGNVLKYCWRYDKKGGVEDLRKAHWYLERMIAECSKQ